MTNQNPSLAINATVYWADLTRQNPRSGKYQVDLGNLSPAAVDALKAHGVNVRNKGDEKADFVTCTSQYPIRATTPDGTEIQAVVGNGSAAVAGGRVVTGNHPVHGPWVKFSIDNLQVTDLVAYEADETDEPINYDDAL